MPCVYWLFKTKRFFFLQEDFEKKLANLKSVIIFALQF